MCLILMKASFVVWYSGSDTKKVILKKIKKKLYSVVKRRKKMEKDSP